jgi:putative SOS response-associated peptidase YedK
VPSFSTTVIRLCGLSMPTTRAYSSDGNLFAFAGVWKDGQGHWLRSFAIVTTEANEMMARIHPRMPVILHPSDYDRWLDRDETERLPVDLLRPFESEAMEMREANPKVNNARNNESEMLERIDQMTQSGIFPL